MHFHAVATLPGGRRKSIVNKSEDQMLAEYVLPYVQTGIMRVKWGANTQSYQVLELRVFATEKPWVKT